MASAHDRTASAHDRVARKLCEHYYGAAADQVFITVALPDVPGHIVLTSGLETKKEIALGKVTLKHPPMTTCRLSSTTNVAHFGVTAYILKFHLVREGTAYKYEYVLNHYEVGVYRQMAKYSTLRAFNYAKKRGTLVSNIKGRV